VDLRLGFPSAQQSCDATDAFVNLLARAFDENLALAGADDWLFHRATHKNFKTLAKLRRLFDPPY